MRISPWQQTLFYSSKPLTTVLYSILHSMENGKQVPQAHVMPPVLHRPQHSCIHKYASSSCTQTSKLSTTATSPLALRGSKHIVHHKPNQIEEDGDSKNCIPVIARNIQYNARRIDANQPRQTCKSV